MLRDSWKKYLQDPYSADEGDFTALLTDSDERISPEEAFSFIDENSEVARRARSLMDQTKFNGLYYLPDPQNFMSCEALMRMAGDQVDGFCDFFRETDNAALANSMSNLEKRVTRNRNEFNKIVSDSFQNRGVNIIGDRLIRATFEKDERLSAVREAALGLTMDVFVADYIITGAVRFPISYKPGFELYIGGGEMAVLNDMIILLVPEGSSIS